MNTQTTFQVEREYFGGPNPGRWNWIPGGNEHDTEEAAKADLATCYPTKFARAFRVVRITKTIEVI